MASSAVLVKVDGGRVTQVLQQTRENLDAAQGEVVLDFSSLPRIDSAALRALQLLAEAAEAKGTKIVMTNVNVDIYKVLKLMKLDSRFTFA